MIEKNDYAIYKNKVVRILDSKMINGRLRHKISNNSGWFETSDLSEIETTEDNYWILYDTLEEEYNHNGNSDFGILMGLSPQKDSWVDTENNINITSYQEFKDLCRQNKVHVPQTALSDAAHTNRVGEVAEEG